MEKQNFLVMYYNENTLMKLSVKYALIFLSFKKTQQSFKKNVYFCKHLPGEIYPRKYC